MLAVSFKLGMMIDPILLFILIQSESDWPWLKITGVRESKNVCVNYHKKGEPYLRDFIENNFSIWLLFRHLLTGFFQIMYVDKDF